MLILILLLVVVLNSFLVYILLDNLDVFVVNLIINGFFNSVNWCEDLNLVVGEDV